MPRGKSSGEPKPFIHLLLLCGWDIPAEDYPIEVLSHPSEGGLFRSFHPSAFFSSVKPMVFSHPLSLPIIVANSRLEDYSFSHWGQAGLEPAFPIHRVVTIGYCPHLRLHYTIVFEVCQGVFSCFRNFFYWASLGYPMRHFLFSGLSPLDNYSIADRG